MVKMEILGEKFSNTDNQSPRLAKIEDSEAAREMHHFHRDEKFYEKV